MSLITPSELRDVSGITDEQKNLIKKFMQGAVYCWIKNRSGEQFAARDLVGGENFDWTGTPLKALYDKHKAKGKSSAEAIDDAGKDLGWLLKSVIHEDKRRFESDKSGLVSVYRWLGGEP